MAPCRDLEIANLVDISHCEPGRPGPELFLPGGATNTERLDRFSDWFGHTESRFLWAFLCARNGHAHKRGALTTAWPIAPHTSPMGPVISSGHDPHADLADRAADGPSPPHGER